MTIETRKILFIQEFLKLKNEKAISRLEKVLQDQINFDESNMNEPITEYELNKRIDQSESDFRNSRFKTSSELIDKYEKK
jgi:hypothetical protein